MLYQVGAKLTPLASFLPKFELETDVPDFFDESLRPMTIKVEIPDPNRLGYIALRSKRYFDILQLGNLMDAKT